MDQTTLIETSDEAAMTEEEIALAAKLRQYIIGQAKAQRLAKRLRKRSMTSPSERAEILATLKLADDLSIIQSYIDTHRFWLTVAHLRYGDLRGRAHPVAEPKPYRDHFSYFKGYVLIA